MRREKPGYRTSRRQLWASFWFGWAVIIGIVWAGVNGSQEAVQLASVTIPAMVMLIAALLGIHRYTGSMDFAAIAEQVPPPEPPYSARDQPASEEIQ